MVCKLGFGYRFKHLVAEVSPCLVRWHHTNTPESWISLHSYLFYFDGIRNTKASFNITFNGTGVVTPPTSGISLAPNPVKNTLTINLKGTSAGKYQFLVYDILGRETAVLLNSNLAPGSYEISFDASSLSSGVYFYMFKAGEFSEVKKMELIK